MEIDCKERVAFDLMKMILIQPTMTDKRPFDYDGMLDLYLECLKAVRGTRNQKPVTFSGF